MERFQEFSKKMAAPREWEALPQRKTRRRSTRNGTEPSVPATAAAAAAAAATVATAATAATAAMATAATAPTAASAAASTAAPSATAEAERYAAVTRAVEARSRMSRCCGDLEGGAGADGANFECE